MKHHVVVDLEMCRVPRANRTAEYIWKNETIQIGAVLLDENYAVADQFSTFVSPEYGYIDTFIKQFTGIEPKDVMDAPKMEKALQMFTEWIPEGDVAIVSWSGNDKLQIERELTGKNIRNQKIERLLENWNDCQVTFSEIMDTKRRYSLNEALIAADIISEGREHNGLSDAYNTALLFAKMETEEEFKLNETYESARSDKEEHLTSSLGDIFGLLNIQFAS